MLSSLTLVTVTYNSQKEITKLFDSISGNVRQGLQIIVVDNASTDQTVKLLQKVKNVKIIRNNHNVGFAKACNQAAKITNSEYLLFLNPDTIVQPGCIEKMVVFLKSKKDAAVVGCKILNHDGTLQPSCGNFPTITNIILDRIPYLNKIFRTELIRQEDYYQYEYTPNWVSGTFFLVKREVFEKIGGFNERYFMYVEDVDFCYRARQAGYKMYYSPKAEIIHLDQGKFLSRKASKAKNMREGFTTFFEKYKSPLYLVIWKTILGIESRFK